MPDVNDAPVARGADSFALSRVFEAANQNQVGLLPEMKAHGKRMIMLTGEVTREKADAICAALLGLSMDKPGQDILFYINSPGGSVTAGMAIFDMMRSIPCDVRTVGMGQCASMGAFLLAGGTKGKRSLFPNAQIMLHQPSAGTSGKVSDMERDLAEFLKIKARMTDGFTHFMDVDRSDAEKLLDRDTYINSAAAQRLGLVDKIIVKASFENQPLTDDEKKLFALQNSRFHEELAKEPVLLDIIARRNPTPYPPPQLVVSNDIAPEAPRLAS